MAKAHALLASVRLVVKSDHSPESPEFEADVLRAFKRAVPKLDCNIPRMWRFVYRPPKNSEQFHLVTEGLDKP